MQNYNKQLQGTKKKWKWYQESYDSNKGNIDKYDCIGRCSLFMYHMQ